MRLEDHQSSWPTAPEGLLTKTCHYRRAGGVKHDDVELGKHLLSIE
jgi:hypothetical protein